MFEIAGGILLAVAILATAVIWVPAVAGLAVLAAFAGVVWLLLSFPEAALAFAGVIATPFVIVWLFGVAGWLVRCVVNSFIPKEQKSEP